MHRRIAGLVSVLALLSGVAFAGSVIDGDTLVVGRLKYRLCGIDAPERYHAGYQEAADHLRAIIRGKTVTCIPVGQGTPCDGRSPVKSHDRIVAACFVDGKDLAAELVRSGHAQDWPKFSGGYYGALK